MRLINAIRWALLRAALSGFVVTMTVFCIAQNSLVSVYEMDARPGIDSSPLASGRRQPFKTFYDRGVPNISAAGKQGIGCSHGLSNRDSLEALGKSYAQQVERTSALVTDPEVTEYVNRIAQNLAHNSDAQIQLTVKVIDTDEVNAVSLPSGLILVNSGLIAAAGNEAELAGVISHEIAHVAACHPVQEIVRAETTNFGSMPLIYRLLFRRFTLNTIYMNPARTFEFEADSLGVEYLYKAGYDPQAMLSMLEKVKAIEKQAPGHRGNAFEARSLTIDRIARARQKINALLLPSQEYRVDTTDFQRIKERLSQMRKAAITQQ